MKWDLADKALQSDFLPLVEQLSGENVSACSQCGKCSGGCPVLPEVNVSPNRAIRMVQMGLSESALSSDIIWNCAGCGTCTGECPANAIQLVNYTDEQIMLSHIGGLGSWLPEVAAGQEIGVQG